MRSYLFAEPSSKMAIRQRFAALIYNLLSVTNIITTLALLAVPVSYGLVDHWLSTRAKGIFGPSLDWPLRASQVNGWVVSLVTGYRIAVAEGHAAYWIAPCEYLHCAHISAFANIR